MRVMSRNEELLHKQLLRLADGDALLVEKAISQASREEGTSDVTLDSILQSLAHLWSPTVGDDSHHIKLPTADI